MMVVRVEYVTFLGSSGKTRAYLDIPEADYQRLKSSLEMAEKNDDFALSRRIRIEAEGHYPSAGKGAAARCEHEL